MKNILLISVLIIISSCSSRNFIVTKIYFGLTGPNNTVISGKDFDIFVDSTITPLFPNGFTVYSTEGRWKNISNETIKEDSRVIEIINAAKTEDREKIRTIAKSYKKRFQQESVLITEESVIADF